VIERHIAYNAHAGQEHAFEAHIRLDYAPSMSRMDGFRRVTLLRDAETPTFHHMVIAFESPEAPAAWRASVEHKTLTPTLQGFFSQSQVVTYDVVAERP
jgi:heme-degrading monooxygenase HmoA